MVKQKVSTAVGGT